MGYRSEVAIGLTDNAVRLLETITEHHEGLRELCAGSEGNIKFPIPHPDAGSDHEGVLYWDYIQWYTDDPDIGAMESFLNTLPAEDYRFARVGEETDDNEEHGDYYDSEIHISRSISW